ncbi:unnamed protein product, partial [Linum tenue]
MLVPAVSEVGIPRKISFLTPTATCVRRPSPRLVVGRPPAVTFLPYSSSGSPPRPSTPPWALLDYSFMGLEPTTAQ